MERTNPITPAGFAALRARYQQLFAVERPAVVETVSWAAGNGDRSENGDYIYGKQKLRAIDRELGQLSKKMKFANVLDPAKQPDRSRVFFGATILLADIDDTHRTVTIVGDDEAEASDGRIGWNSPLARALRGAKVGDVKTVTLPSGPKEWEVMEISYPDGVE
ncbi:GreA/GreB family elongation factor [Sphingorhabdus lacus]|jgi:transcription elongation factor GreB|uniref:Transcription elongation factor GreB n=1 Tax=Sphingorhabdus lacus TaxID=392610 RepID=A0A6I6L696_9SPHN|nr:GreA/GreB family elongation factor [Sphingorhabdus lacus]QGY80164.1 transcription elongation factor GreB [Sphingorhabdus lacus]HPV67720.1 GreA/GreB family elongation factor [Sphingorhabdus lacus]